MSEQTADYREYSDGRRFVSFATAVRDWGLSERTLRRLIDRGKLRLFKPSPRRALLSVAELDRLVETSACSA